MKFELLELVALAVDLPRYGLERGDTGTVVEVYPKGVAAEVEFVTVGGHTTAVVTLTPDQFSPLDPYDMLAVRRLNAA